MFDVFGPQGSLVQMPSVRQGKLAVNVAKQAGIIADATPTMVEWLGTGGLIVHQEVAQKRTDACLRCPMRAPTPKLLGAAADGIKRILELKSGLGLKVQGEKSLGICLACNCVNRLKIWMPREKVLAELSAEEFSRLDQSCWIINE